MMICYSKDKKKITKEFSSIETIKEGGLFTAKFSIVGTTPDGERVVLYSGLSNKKKAERLVRRISLDCSSNTWLGGGIHYV